MTTAEAKTTKKSPKASKKSAEVKVGDMPRLRIRVRAYEYKILDASLKQIMDTALRYDVTFYGPIPLPTEIKKYTVNRSSFVHKNAREQFEMRVHKRLIDILNPNPKIIEALTNLSLPSGVSIDVKMM
jgi:small subunit ribosomal protein S10